MSESIAKVTGRNLDFAIIGVLAVAVAFFAVDRFLLVEKTSSFSASTVDRRSIAALPFSNDSVEEENAEFFANGIHDELLTQLAKIGSLKVISRTSVMEYRDHTKNIVEIGRELGVAAILEGSVQRAGNTIRINVQLIDAETDEHLWAEIYDRQLTAENMFAVQSEMAASIAAALQTTLSPEEVIRLGEVPTQSTQAYDFYLAGNDYFGRLDFRTYLPMAVQMYERAVEEDSQFALALAKLSVAHGLLHWYGLDRSDTRLDMAEEAARRALALVPELPEAHLALGYYHYRGFRDYGRAFAEFSIAERGLPGTSEVHEARAYVMRRLGQWDESLASMARAIELDPRNANLFFQQAGTYNMLRDFVQADDHLRRSFDLAQDSVNTYIFMTQIPLRRDGDVTLANAAAENPPLDIGVARQWLGWTAAIYERDYDRAISFLDDWGVEAFDQQFEYLSKSALYGLTYKLAGDSGLADPQLQAARSELEAMLEGSPEDERIYVSLAQVLAELGEREEAVRMARQAMELVPPSRDAYAAPDTQLLAVKVFAAAGDHDAAFGTLDAYLAAPGDWSIEGLMPDPRLDPIRDDPRFQALLEKYRRQN